MYEYNEEEIERFGKEGGGFLIKNGIIDTDDLEEVREFRKKIKEEEIEKNGYENSLRKKFSFIKESERSNEKMSYYEYADSADNADDKELLIDEIREFYGNEELDSDFEKALKKIPEKMLAGLKEAFKTLNENSEILEDYPDLKTAMKYIGKFVDYPYPYPSKPGKYPYPGKIKKSDQPILWSDMLEQMFPDEPNEDEDFEKSDEGPWPSFGKAIRKQAKEIEKAEDQLEEQNFDPYDRRI